MGDDKPPNSAKEGLQIYILSRMVFHSFSTYYPLRLTLPPRNVCSHLRLCYLPILLYLTKLCRNKKYMASTRPVLHLPSLLLHAPYWHSVGHCLHQFRWRCRAVDAPLRLRTLPYGIIVGCNGSFLPGGEAAGTGHCRVTWQEEAAGVIHAGWGG